MDVRLLLVPYDSGQRGVRMGAGPECICPNLKKQLVRQRHAVDEKTIEPASPGWHAEVQTSFELMRAIAVQVRRARADRRFPLVLSGNCNAALGVLGALGPDTGVIWFDAHGDFNTPQTTMSGFFDGMTLATATGRCWAEMARSIDGFAPVPDDALILLGVRDLDPGEAATLSRSQIVRLGVREAGEQLPLILANLSGRLKQFYLHLDLDALDPTEGRANAFAVPDGFSRDHLQALLNTVASTLPISAMTLASYDPAFDHDGAVRRFAAEAALTVLHAQTRR